ncbi:MAG: NAD(P)H-binding protein [Croceibacterium sp.]
MTLALTGGTGFVGQAVLAEAARRGARVRALARRPHPPREGVEWVRGDMSDTGAVAALVAGADAVLHVAGVINAPDREGFQVGNVAGTAGLVDAARAALVTRFVFVSSLAAREPALSAYGQSKFEAEQLVQASGLDWTIVRPPAIYGPHDREMLELFKVARWGVVPMPPTGRASIIHVDDLARLLLGLIPGSPATRKRTFEPDDGHPEGWEHDELARAIGTAVGRKVRVPRLSKRMLTGAARIDRLVRGDRAKLTVDRVGYIVHPDWVSRPDYAVPAEFWQPWIETAEGLSDTARWYRAHGWL